MDMIDARIIGEMISDCRISYNALAEKLEMTANAIRGRVSKLLEAGVLCFDVCLSYAQVGAQPLLVEVRMESNVTSDSIIEELGQHLLIYVVTPLPDGHLILVADYRSPVEMANLLQFVRTRESVVDISSHSLITAQGKKGDINLDQVRVLKSLLDDPRKPITAIADDIGMTARRVRRALQKCYDEETIQFASRWNPNLGDSPAVVSKIRWNPDSFELREAVLWLHEAFPEQYWYSYLSATEPVFFSTFILDHIRDMEGIDVKLEESSRVDHADTQFVYPSRLYPRPRRVWLEEFIDEQLGSSA